MQIKKNVRNIFIDGLQKEKVRPKSYQSIQNKKCIPDNDAFKYFSIY